MKAIVVSPAQNLESSKNFYQKLGFQYENYKNHHYVGDGEFIIQLDSRPEARTGIAFYGNDVPKNTKMVNGVNTGVDPNGVYVYVKQSRQYPTLQFKSNQSFLGNFAGISLESLNLESTIEFWTQYGYLITAGGPENGWIQMENESGLGVAIMKYGTCPHSFRNPSLTFFNGSSNIDIINKIRSTDTWIAEEITHFNKDNIVDNIVLVDPGGYGMFIFSD